MEVFVKAGTSKQRKIYTLELFFRPFINGKLLRLLIVLSISLILLLATSAGTVMAEWTEWSMDLELGYRFDDNINLTDMANLKQDDHIFVPSFSFGRYYQLANNTRLRVSADFNGTVHRNFHQLNSLESGMTLALFHKFGVGYEVPWIRLHTKPSFLAVRDSSREGFLFSTGFTVGKEIIERLTATVGYEFFLREANDGDPVPHKHSHGVGNDVFDQTAHSGNFALSYQITNDLLATAGYQIRYGDIASTVGKGHMKVVGDIMKAIANDNVYGLPGWWTYRLKVKTHKVSVGFSYAITGNSAVNVNYAHVDGYDEHVHYEDNLAGFSLQYSL